MNCVGNIFNNLRYRSLKCLTICLFAAIILLNFQNDLSSGSNSLSAGEERSRQPMNDSIFSADSVKMQRYLDTIWYFYNYGKFDSIIWGGRQMEKLGEQLLAYKQDSLVELLYGDGKLFIGQGMTFQGRFEEGLPIFEKYVKYYEAKYGLTRELSHSYVGLAVAYGRMGDLENELYYLEKATRIVEQVMPKGHYYHGNKYRNLGLIHRQLGNFNRSIQFYEKAIANYSTSSPRAVPVCHVELSEVFKEKGDMEKAFDACYKSIELADSILPEESLSRFLARPFLQLGQLHLETGKPEESIRFLLKALAQLPGTSSGSPEPEAGSVVVFNSLGKAYTEIGAFSQAIEYFNRAIEDAGIYYGKSALDNIHLYLDKARAYEAMDSLENALRQYQRALHHLNGDIPEEDFLANLEPEQLPAIPEAIEAMRAKAIALKKYFDEAPGKVEESFAFFTFELTQILIERLLGSHLNRSSQSRLVRENLAFYEAGIGLAASLYNRSREGRYLDWAFNFMEKSKAAVLLGSLQESRAGRFSDVPGAILEKEKELRKQAGIYENLFFQERNKEKPDSQLVMHYQDRLFRYRKAKDSLKNVLEDRYPEYYQLKYGLEVASIRDVRKKLKRDEGLIEYFLGDHTLFVLSLSRNTENLQPIPVDAAFFDRMFAFQKAASSPPPGGESPEAGLELVDNGHFLYKVLLEPFARELDAPKLVLIPDGFLGYLPFHAFITEPVEGSRFRGYRRLPYVMNNWSIREEYSATLMLLERPAAKKTDAYLGFAPEYEGDELLASRGADSLLIADLYGPLVREGLSPLQYNAEEVENASQAFDGKSFVGDKALESQFKTWAPTSRAIHLAMHALTNDREPLYSQLVFSKEPDTLEDGFLHAYEIYNLDLSATDIAVLSACNTGVGKLQRGEGLMSLSRAFKYAGCPNVVMSLWKADDYATKEIVSSFFAHLKDNKGKAEALQLARREFLASTGDNRTHPYYWAGLALVGDDEALGERRNLWMWGIAFFGAAFLVFFARKWIRL